MGRRLLLTFLFYEEALSKVDGWFGLIGQQLEGLD